MTRGVIQQSLWEMPTEKLLEQSFIDVPPDRFTYGAIFQREDGELSAEIDGVRYHVLRARTGEMPRYAIPEDPSGNAWRVEGSHS